LESATKSTAVHAKVLAREDVELHEADVKDSGTTAIFPRHFDTQRTLLLFPTPNAKPISEYPTDSFDSIIVIDGTWRQANALLRDNYWQQFRAVTIPDRKTSFWRYQNKSASYLATIEAIYYMYHDAIQAQIDKTEAQIAKDNLKETLVQLDNLLFFFAHNMDIINKEHGDKAVIDRPYSLQRTFAWSGFAPRGPQEPGHRKKAKHSHDHATEDSSK